jgi:tRNA dimethylallyltransferase
MFEGPPADPKLRERWQAYAEEHGGEAVRRQLAQVDPAAAERLQAGDVRRLIRALEVFETTGVPISDLQKQFDRPAEPPPAVACLQRDRGELYELIHRRIDAMLQAGWIDEVRRLLAGPRPLGREASQAAGYREIMEHLAGRMQREEMLEWIQRRTRRLAKHQQTWFRGLSEIRFFPVAADEAPVQVADRLAAFYRAHSAAN